MIRVQMFSEEDEEELQESINAFLEESDEIEVLSIQFQMNHVMEENDLLSVYSAILVYRLESE